MIPLLDLVRSHGVAITPLIVPPPDLRRPPVPEPSPFSRADVEALRSGRGDAWELCLLLADVIEARLDRDERRAA